MALAFVKEIPTMVVGMTDARTSRRHVADFPFSRWLDAKIGVRSLRHVERDSGIRASLLSTYISRGVVPTAWTAQRLATYLQVELAEIERFRPADSNTRGGAGLPGITPDQLPAAWRDEIRDAVIAGFRRASDEIEVHDASEPAAAGVGAADPAAQTLSTVRRFLRVRITGECMEPRIRNGSFVLVEAGADYRENDIVIARVDDEHLCKRVVRHDGQQQFCRLEKLRPDSVRHALAHPCHPARCDALRVCVALYRPLVKAVTTGSCDVLHTRSAVKALSLR